MAVLRDREPSSAAVARPRRAVTLAAASSRTVLESLDPVTPRRPGRSGRRGASPRRPTNSRPSVRAARAPATHVMSGRLLVRWGARSWKVRARPCESVRPARCRRSRRGIDVRCRGRTAPPNRGQPPANGRVAENRRTPSANRVQVSTLNGGLLRTLTDRRCWSCAQKWGR
jgi:hypothetical protein